MRSNLFFLCGWLLASPAVALNCEKALSPDEKAICDSPLLLKQDKELNSTFEALLSNASPETKGNLRAAQRLWLRNSRNCEGDGKCLENAVSKRLQLLGGIQGSGPGTGSQLSYSAYADDAPDWTLVEGLRFLDARKPYQQLWNNAFDKTVAERKQNPAPTKDEESGDSPDSNNYLSDHFNVTFASSKLLSGTHYAESYFAGAAHPEWDQTGINIDVQLGQKLAFEKVVNAEAEDALVQACAVQSDTVGGVGPEDMPKLKTAVSDMQYWHFTQDDAILSFPPFTFGGYLQPITACRFTIDELKPFLHKDFKAWP